MKKIYTVAVFVLFSCIQVWGQCNPPSINILNLPEHICESDAPIPLVGEPVGGFFLINGMPVNFFDANNLALGSHPVTYFLIYDQDCPPINVTQIVTIHPNLEIEISNDTITCINPHGQLTLSSNNPVQNYQWFGPNGYFSEDPIATTTVSGEYFAIVDNLGCTAMETLNIIENTSPPLNAMATSSSLDCVTNSATLSASSDSPFLEYNWIGPDGFSANSENVEVSSSGSYLVNMTNQENGCIVTIPIEVAPAVLPDLFVSIQGMLDCNNPTVSGSINSATIGVSYRWTLPDGTILPSASIDIQEEGNYVASVIDLLGCTNIDTIIVNADFETPEIIVDQTSQTLTCSISSIDLSVDNIDTSFNTEWTNSSLTTLSNDNFLQVTQPDAYILNVIDPSNGCDTTVTIQINLDTISPITFITQENILCNDSFGILSGNGSLANDPIGYNWSFVGTDNLPNSTADSIRIDRPGVYLLEITDGQNGCTSVDTFEVLIPSVFPEGVEIGIISPDCDGDNGVVELTGENIIENSFNFDYLGFNSGTFFSNLNADQYLLEIKDQDGCLYDTLLTIESVDLNVELIVEDNNIRQGQVIEIFADISTNFMDLENILWLTENDTLCSGCQTLSTSFNESTNIQLIATNEFGCTGFDEIQLYVRKELDFYLGNVFSPNNDGTNDNLILHFGPSVTVIPEFLIFDRWGNLVYQSPQEVLDSGSTSWNGEINGQKAPEGTYIYKAEINYIDGRSQIIGGDVLLIR